MKSEVPNDNKSNRLTRLPKSRIPSFSSQSESFSYSQISSHHSHKTPNLPGSHLLPSNSKPLESDNKQWNATEKELQGLHSLPKPVLDSSPSNYRYLNNNDNIHSKLIKPIYGIRTSGTLDLSNISDRSNFSNISRPNVSSTVLTRGTGSTERSSKGSGRYYAPTFEFPSKEIVTTSVPNFSNLLASHNNTNIPYKGNHNFSHNLHNPKQPSITQQYMRSQLNQSNPKHIPRTSVCAKTEFVLVKKSEKTYPMKREGPDSEKPMEAPRSVLAEKTFNKGERAHLSHILRDQKYSKESKENVKPLRIGENDQDLQDMKENIHNVNNPNILHEGRSNTKETTSSPQYCPTSNKAFLQENYSPNFDESPIKINPIRTLKKFHAKEKVNQEVDKKGFSKVTKSLSLCQSNNKSDKTQMEKALFKKEPLFKKSYSLTNKHNEKSPLNHSISSFETFAVQRNNARQGKEYNL